MRRTIILQGIHTRPRYTNLLATLRFGHVSHLQLLSFYAVHEHTTGIRLLKYR